jgi:uncharacterized protein (DUF433 family)
MIRVGRPTSVKSLMSDAREAYALFGMLFIGILMATKLNRITVDPTIMASHSCVRSMRLTVRRVIEALAVYPNWDDLRAEHPELECEDLRQALVFAARSLDDQMIDLDVA